jgi:hypothetical protein
MKKSDAVAAKEGRAQVEKKQEEKKQASSKRPM